MSSLISTLKTDFPAIQFIKSDLFSWSPSQRAVHYNPSLPHAQALLLHELAHGLLGHLEYHRDVELLSMETAAWAKAKLLAAQYKVKLDENHIQDNLDTYRDWLHARSSCPACGATGYQVSRTGYECPACLHRWRVNEARSCGLRRYKVLPKQT